MSLFPVPSVVGRVTAQRRRLNRGSICQKGGTGNDPRIEDQCVLGESLLSAKIASLISFAIQSGPTRK